MKTSLVQVYKMAGLFAILIFSSCKAEYIEDVNKVCFENDVLPILVSNCTQSGCHNSSDREKDLDYSSYNGVMASGTVKAGNYRSSDLYKVLVVPFGETAMPPDPFVQLSTDQIETISLWIQQGAKNEVCPPSDCNLNDITYSGGVRPILEKFCNGCHSGSNPTGSISYSTYNGVKATVDNGKLMGSIKHDFGYISMPQNGSKLSDCNIDIIQMWIDAGALNN